MARLQEWDTAGFRAVAATTTPLLDEPLRRLSLAANYSRLSMASAALLGFVGGARGRRAAVTGLASVAVASATANAGAKLLTRRKRPDRQRLAVIERRQIKMPSSTSFPSGHSASAFAFASGVRHEWPAASVPLYVLAVTVAYSRVHTGVHYPGDVLAGSAIGMGAAAVTRRVVGAVRCRHQATFRSAAPARTSLPTRAI